MSQIVTREWAEFIKHFYERYDEVVTNKNVKQVRLATFVMYTFTKGQPSLNTLVNSISISCVSKVQQGNLCRWLAREL